MKNWFYLFVIIILLAGCSAKKQAIPSTIEPQRITAGKGIQSSDKQIEQLISEARKWLGTPYVYGGSSRSGTDCSGMIMELFRTVYNIKLPRSAAMQQSYSSEIERNNLTAGDLIFFCTGKSKNRVSHVGLYIGKGKMIHASSSRGVMESGIEERYWQRTYYSSGRIINQQKQPSQKDSTQLPKPAATISSEQLQELYDALDQTLDSIYVSNPSIFD